MITIRGCVWWSRCGSLRLGAVGRDGPGWGVWASITWESSCSCSPSATLSPPSPSSSTSHSH